MERKFKTGDVVRLNSDTMNNEVMTVRGYQYDIAMESPQNRPFIGGFSESINKNVVCDWRDKMDVPQSQVYKEDELVKV